MILNDLLLTYLGTIHLLCRVFLKFYKDWSSWSKITRILRSSLSFNSQIQSSRPYLKTSLVQGGLEDVLQISQKGTTAALWLLVSEQN